MSLRKILGTWRTPRKYVEVFWIPGVDGPYTYIRDPETRRGATMNREGPIGAEMLPPVARPNGSISTFRTAFKEARTFATKKGLPVVVSGGLSGETVWSRGKRTWMSGRAALILSIDV